MRKKRIVRIEMTTTNGRPVTPPPPGPEMGLGANRTVKEASRKQEDMHEEMQKGLDPQDLKMNASAAITTFDYETATNQIISCDGKLCSEYRPAGLPEDEVTVKYIITQFDSTRALTLTNYENNQPLLLNGASGKILCLVEITPKASGKPNNRHVRVDVADDQHH